MTVVYEQQKRLESQAQELEEARRQLEDRRIALKNSGSIAEAALELNGVFEAAQRSVEQYLENIEGVSGVRKDGKEGARLTDGAAPARERRSRGSAAGISGDALAAQARWNDVRRQFDEYLAAHCGLKELLESLGVSFESIFGQQTRGSKE